MSIFKSTEQTCLDKLKTLHDTRGRLEAAITEHATELARLKAGVSEDAALDAFLTGEVARNDDGFPVAARPHAAAVEQELVDLRGARLALARRVRGAIVDLGKARADAFRKQASKRLDELDKHRARTIELLKELETHASCRYIVDVNAGADILVDSAGHESVFRRGSRPAPKSFEYEAEINRLLAQARSVEARAQQATEGGQVAAETLDELLKVAADIERLAPTEAAIRIWFAEASAKAEAEWTVTAAELAGEYDATGKLRAAAADRDVSFSLAWSQDGEIIPEHSKATNRPKLVWNAQLPAPGSAAANVRQW